MATITFNGTAGNDTFVGTSGNNYVLSGGSGNDKLVGGNLNDTIAGGAGADTLIGGAGIDTLDYGGGGNSVTINLALNLASGNEAAGDVISGFENVRGSWGSDLLIGTAGNNYLHGGGGGVRGNDTLEGGAGADTLACDGNSDSMLSYEHSAAAVTVNLNTQTASGGDATGDQIVSRFTGVMGTAFNDMLIGTSSNYGAGRLSGGGGNDTLVAHDGGIYDGGSGVDTLNFDVGFYGVTADLTRGIGSSRGGAYGIQEFTLRDVENVTGGGYDDRLTGSAGANIIDGGSGNDTIEGRGGADVLIGGNGIDTLAYSNSAAGVIVNLATGQIGGGDAAGDVVTGFENVVGSAFADVLTGTAGINLIDGGAGNDTIIGGAGQDGMSGGAGADLFGFISITDSSGAASSLDVISDFTRGVDRIDLSAIDANILLAGNQAFIFSAWPAGFSGRVGEVYFNSAAHVLYGDTNGDRIADFGVTLTGINALAAGDLIL